MTIGWNMRDRKKKISISIDREVLDRINEKKGKDDTVSSFINTILRAVVN